MFIYGKVCHSKFVETKCTGTLQVFIDLHPSPIGILLLKLRSIYRTVYMQTRVNVNNKIDFEPQ